MRILLLSDFHYKIPNAVGRDDHAALLGTLLESIDSKKQPIDIVLFAGDLVNRGQDAEAFSLARNILLNKVLDYCGLDKNRLFVCAGNHDVNRNEVHPAVLDFIHRISKNSELDEFASGNKDLENSLMPLKNYNEFSTTLYPDTGNSTNTAFYSTHIREIEGKKLGIAAINSSWCCSSKDDEMSKPLRYPLTILKDAHHQIRLCDTKILLMHHPLSAFESFNGEMLEEFIHTNFDLLIQGHIHDPRTATHFRASNGIFEKIAPATVSFDGSSTLGYSVLTFDLTNPSEIEVQDVLYNRTTQSFEKTEPHFVPIPCNHLKHKQNELRTKLKKLFSSELGKANDLMLNNDDPEAFLKYFTDPVLRTRPEAEITTKEDASIVHFEDILETRDDLLIIGDDKYGKTSLLRRIQLHLLQNHARIGVIPYYFDCKEISITNKSTGLLTLISRHLELNKSDTEALLLDGRLRILADNVVPNHPNFHFIEDFLQKYDKVSFAFTSDASILTAIGGIAARTVTAQRLYIHDLGRRQLRNYTGKWIQGRSLDPENIMDHIMKLCDQMHLPLNYWTVSILLDIYEKSRDDNSKNLYAVLDMCIEEILNKRVLAVTRTPVNYDQYKELCSNLAFFLYQEGPETVHSAPVANVFSFITDYINQDPRFVGNSSDVYRYLINSQILKERENGMVTFRLSGFFEYFLAFYLTINSEFREGILSDSSSFYAFKNEFELYSGFQRKDRDFLEKVFDRTMKLSHAIESDYPSGDSIDTILIREAGNKDVAEAMGKLAGAKPLTETEKDDLLDSSHPIHIQSDVQPKVFSEEGMEPFLLLEKSLRILGRVIKNMDGIKDMSFISRLVKETVRSYCYLGFKIIESVTKSSFGADGAPERDVDARELYEIASNFIPLYIQVSLFDAIGHQNLRKVIRELIQDYKQDLTPRQFELFLLSFLLIDSDLKGSFAELDDIIKNINLGILRYSIYLKLNYYLVFKVGRDEKLEAELRKRIQELSKEFQPKADLGSLHRRFSKTHNRNVAKTTFKT